MALILRKRISPTKAKFISTLAVSGIIMAIVFLLTSTVMQKNLNRAEKQYMNSCTHVLDGYANAIQFYLENYHTSLSSIYHKELFQKGNKKAIHEWLIQNIPFVHEDFNQVFYIDATTNAAYFSNGNIVNLTGQEFLEEAKFDEENYYVSNLQQLDYSTSPIFIIEEPYFDSENNLKGILCASIKIEELKRISSVIKIDKTSSVYVTDRNGNFLIHPMNEYIGKIFVPKSEKYKGITSVKTASSGDTIVETENEKGEVIDLFSTTIKNCGWTLAVGFPKEEFNKIYKQQTSTKFAVLFISIFSLIILLTIESAISNYFYKNQLIEAVYDPLTNLWTRQKFEMEAERLFKKNPKDKFILLESDIKGFKFINLNYGEEAADKMIFFYSTQVNKIIKAHRGIIGHGYADHFYSLIRTQNLKQTLQQLSEAQKVLSQKIKEYEIPFFPKFGLTFHKPARHPDVTIKELIGQASFAKSTIKENMLVPYAFYKVRLLGKINEERYIEHSMEDALKNNEFFVMYQPKILLANDSVVGAEALVRWKTAEFGMIYPNNFIPLFERNGFIIKLDFYVYEQVFKFLDTQIKAGKPVVPISVNMSRNHNKPEQFMSEFMELFKKYDIPPHLIQVEIIERSVMDSNTLCEITNRLHQEGFSVAMDDFGSGESSLNMLTKIPVDVLKFDREFLLSSMNEKGELEDKSAKFIQSLIDLSKSLDKETIFEGVETEAQRDFLKSIKCDQVQGYFYSRPLIESDFVNFINQHAH
ncbi:GGDEF domain-containing protein [uncultured Treponema sp.]|uniref:GGDEF domain-containing protein n=1 Tax=uncultured Treponema sp. TaxID=162155 RepID=UPI0025F02E0F|nr:GGDEF domain-containing protein [uncultured Treponema sp.]